jgi:predicted NAD-dependent protein-ADP-ribosyltransferase YbiA (DUF1768 family)
MDVSSSKKYPSGALSNFAPHPFMYHGTRVNSMEGFLQGLKFKNPEMQKHVFTLVGFAAKKKGSKKNWQGQQHTLWFFGKPVDRLGDDYQAILDDVYNELTRQNAGFRKALLATGNAVFSHSIGKRNAKNTVLTENEFCRRLTAMRDYAKDINDGNDVSSKGLTGRFTEDIESLGNDQKELDPEMGDILDRNFYDLL